MVRHFVYVSLAVMAMVFSSCSKDEAVIVPEQEEEEETTGQTSEREVWEFDVKVMIDRETFKLCMSDEEIVKKKLQERFDDVAELYHGKKEITYIDADIKFNPVFESSFVYDESSEEMFRNGAKHRGEYPYLLIMDACVGDYEGERTHSDWTGWGYEVVCMFDNGLGAADGGATVYDMLNQYKTSEAIAHELGHARGVPDIYAMEIKSNPVCGLTFSPVKCIMNICWGGDSWSEYSQLLINRNKDLIVGEAGFTPLEKPDFPETVNISFTKDGNTVSDSEVKVYASKMYSGVLDKDPVASFTTDDKGIMSFSPKEIYTDVNSGNYLYGTLMLEIIYGEDKYYSFLPVYNVQVPYLKNSSNEVTLDIKL